MHRIKAENHHHYQAGNYTAKKAYYSTGDGTEHDGQSKHRQERSRIR